MFTTLMVKWLPLTNMASSYDEKYDKIDVDKIIGDESLFTAYIDCMLDKGPCSVENAEDFKKLLPEVIATACAYCSPIQKKSIKKTFKALSDTKPSVVAELQKKYDPNHEYQKEFAAFIVSSD